MKTIAVCNNYKPYSHGYTDGWNAALNVVIDYISLDSDDIDYLNDEKPECVTCTDRVLDFISTIMKGEYKGD